MFSSRSTDPSCVLLLRRLEVSARTQGDDAEGQVVGEFAEQPRLVGREGPGAPGVDGERAEGGVVSISERKGDRREEAALEGLLAPELSSLVAGEVQHRARLPGTDRGADGLAAPARFVGPGDRGGVEVAVVDAR